jgi:hypothetical protein
LTNGNAQRVMDIDTLDAMIDGAKACRHVSDMQTTIHIWEDELTVQLLQHEYGVKARVSTCKARERWQWTWQASGLSQPNPSSDEAYLTIDGPFQQTKLRKKKLTKASRQVIRKLCMPGAFQQQGH